MAWVYGGRHQFDLSILWAEKALAQDPEHLAAHGIIGDAAVERGDYDKVFAHYQAATEALPSIEAPAALGIRESAIGRDGRRRPGEGFHLHLALDAMRTDDGTHQIVSVPYPTFVAERMAGFFKITVALE